MPKLRGALEITQFNPLLLQTDTPQLSQGLFRLPWQEWRACLPEYHLLYFIEQQDRKWPQWRFLPTDLWKRVHAKNLSTRSTSTSLLVLFYLPYSVLKLDSLGQKRMPKVMKSHLHDYVTLPKFLPCYGTCSRDSPCCVDEAGGCEWQWTAGSLKNIERPPAYSQQENPQQ